MVPSLDMAFSLFSAWLPRTTRGSLLRPRFTFTLPRLSHPDRPKPNTTHSILTYTPLFIPDLTYCSRPLFSLTYLSSTTQDNTRSFHSPSLPCPLLYF
ncbi:uncharacterized protein LACBIDRAFT_315354 [Laccaria bicolor S238N-H82]|uniref:Predicted protein n=1 Tax=Laccaria bicolor (strain S238N-H82 / ATCC MYA-4686) TaxID=486041 RepID=B0D273_LACBS|nr:uncharacterized protein LACBIDRAFT_315354 [Laccaria bicolor S238N-H82]EDR11055.1 predicted protein [Laccaria bicolor S238N-H82]|eukprot:XP_001878356.1 predicted protein [Laccaria bicolor S238N-H82]